jgi:hypothetical protein
MEAFSESWMGRRVDRRVKHGAHELSLGPDQRSADVTEDRYKAQRHAHYGAKNDELKTN